VNINIRKAEDKDIYDLFKLSNSPSTRKYSVNSNKIAWEDHKKWFDELVKDDNIVLYILSDEKETFLGQVRYDIKLHYAEISISLVEKVKGRGYGLESLLKSQKMIKREKKVKKIKATVNNSNKPSIKIFERAGYKLSRTGESFSEYILEIKGGSQ